MTGTTRWTTCCAPRPHQDCLALSERATIKARQGVELITSGEIRVVDEEMNDVPADGATIGEIVVRGNVVMKGYYNDPEATAQAFRGGYMHTGDAAVMHPDRYVEVRDRIKDVIISGGENISSVEVEKTLRHPAVLEKRPLSACPTSAGAKRRTFVVSSRARRRRQRRCAFMRDRLAHFKCPQTVTFIPAAEDRDGEDPEVRAARRPRGDHRPVASGFSRTTWIRSVRRPNRLARPQFGT
jgi:fatty-acyl-CoA synthase